MFFLQLKDVKFKNFNEKLEGDVNWRNHELTQPEDVPAQYVPILESPVLFKMEFGDILEIKVDEYEPQWSLNIKKSLLSLLKIKLDDSDDDPASFLKNQDLPSYWESMEDGLDGICKNLYQISEIPVYLLEETWSNLISRDNCPGSAFQIVKNRDINSCLQRAVYQSNQPGKYNCPAGNCDSMFERSSVTRYIGCGANLSDMKVVAIVNEADMHQSLLAYNTEKVVTGSKQVLKFVEVRSTFSSLPEIEDERMIEDLLYEYPEAVTLTGSSMFPQEEKPSNYKEQQELLQGKTDNVRVQRFDKALPQDQETLLSKLSPSLLKQQIVEKLVEITDDLAEIENLEKKEVSSTIMSLTKVFSLLSTEYMMDLYKTLKNLDIPTDKKETANQILLEIAVLSGSNPAIMFLKDLIEMREMSPLRAGAALSTLPHYIKTPTIQVLDQLFDLIQSPVIKEFQWLKSNSELAFATILNRACVDGNRERRFPVNVFGEFCDQETLEITNKYIPYFVDQLNSAKRPEERLALIMILGTTGHESVLPILLPIIERKREGTSAAEQRMAVYSLHAAAKHFRDIILPVYMTLVHNPLEDRSVRIAALSMIVYTEPDTFDLQQLAVSTWFEPDREFHKFIFTMLKSLSELKTQDLTMSGTFRGLAQKAQKAFPLAKPIPGTIPSTLNTFTSEWLKNLQIGYQAHTYFTSMLSLRSFYFKLEYFMEKLSFSPIEIGVRSQGIGRFIEKLGRVFDDQDEMLSSSVHSAWKEIVSQLDLKPFTNIHLQTGFWTKIYDDIQIMAGFGHDLEDTVVHSFRNLISQETQKMCGKTPINLVKVNNWMPSEILIPSDTGLPILMEVHMPGILAINGLVDIDCSTKLPSINLDVSIKISVNQIGYVGTVSPFTKEIVAVGIDEQFVHNLPIRFQLKAEQGFYKLFVTPSGQVKSTDRNVDLLVYHVKPFAVVKHLEFLDITPLTCHTDVKYIQSESSRKVSMRKLGKSLGLDMRYIVETETPIWDAKTRFDQQALFDFSPLNMLLFGWTNTAITVKGTPSARYHQISLFYSPADSQTTEAQFQISIYQSSRREAEEPKITGSLQVTDEASTQFKQQLEESFQNKSLTKLHVAIVQLHILLNGRDPTNILLTAGGGHGSKEKEKHWGCYIEERVNFVKKRELCMAGSLLFSDDQRSGMSRGNDHQIKFENTLGLGQACSNYNLKLSGSASVSDEQKNVALGSKEAKQCKKTSEALVEMKDELKRIKLSDSDDWKVPIMQERLKQKSLKNHDSCNSYHEQMGTLDMINLHLEHNYPFPQHILHRLGLLELNEQLMPFQTSLEDIPSSQNIDAIIKLNPQFNAVTMTLFSPSKSLTYENIRLPNYLQNVVPWYATKGSAEQLFHKVTGMSPYATCWLVDGSVRTFGNQSYVYSVDDCYHVLVADCSADLSHAVLLKEIDGLKHLQVLYGQSEIILKPGQGFSERNPSYVLSVDGENGPVMRSQEMDFPLKDGKTFCRLRRSVFYTFQLIAAIITNPAISTPEF